MKHFFGRENAAKFLGCDPKTVDRLAERGGIKPLSIGIREKSFYTRPQLEQLRAAYAPSRRKRRIA